MIDLDINASHLSKQKKSTLRLVQAEDTNIV